MNQSPNATDKKCPFLRRSCIGPPGVRLAVVLTSSLLYVAAFFLLRTIMDEGATSLSIVPVCLAGWLFGLRGGLAGAGVTVLLNVALLQATGGIGWTLMQEGAATGIVALFLIGPVVGIMSDLAERLQEELEERARTERALRKRTDQMEALHDISMRITSHLDLDALLQDVVEQGCQLLDVHAGSLHLFEEDDNRLHIAVSYGYSKDHTGSCLAPGEGIAGWAFSSGWLVTVDDYSRWEGRSASWEDEGIRSSISAPLRRDKATIGTLTFDRMHGACSNQCDFSEQERWMVDLFANVAAMAIAKADLVAKLRRYADQLEERVAERTTEVNAQMARMEAVLNSVADGIVVTDADDGITMTNPVARDWLRQAEAHEVDLRATIQALSSQSGQHPAESLSLPGLDLALHATPITGAESGQGKAVVTMQDVTHLRAMERARAQFITNTSHNLRTPIATIKMLAQLMERQPDSWRGHWAPMTEEIEHLSDLIEGVLEIARLDATRQEVYFSPVELNLIVEQMAISYEERCAETGLDLVWHPSSATPIVKAAPRDLNKVLRKLMDNALQYTDGGQIVVSVDVGERPPSGVESQAGQLEGAWARITVTDTGWGISEEEQDQVFDRFFRGEKARSMQVSGTGLGLAVAQQIAGLHGGRITVESEVDQGSTFTIWLPLAEQRTGVDAGQ